MVNISIGECLGKGWEGFQRHPGTAIGGFFLYTLICVVGQSIPFLNIAFLIFVQAPLAGGLVILFLRLAKDASPAVGDIFDGFDKYGKFMGAFWLLYVVILGCAIPALIGLGIAMAAERQLGDGAAAAIGVTGVLVSLVIVIVVAIRWVFVFFLLADEENLGVIDAFKKSSELTRGWRAKLLLTLFVMSLVSFLGILLLIVGMFVTGPIVGIGVAWLYTEAKRQVMASRGSLAPQPVTSPPPIG